MIGTWYAGATRKVATRNGPAARSERPARAPADRPTLQPEREGIRHAPIPGLRRERRDGTGCIEPDIGVELPRQFDMGKCLGAHSPAGR
jgi:hypothetical protein